MERKFDMQNGSNFGTKSVTNKAITNIHFSVGLALVLPVETHSNAKTKIYLNVYLIILRTNLCCTVFYK